jgi:predicted RNase H-like HicB family nuclease
MSGYHINIFFSDEDGGYIADIPDLRVCSAFAGTPEEALAEVERAKTAWLAAAREAGKAVPRPLPLPPHLPNRTTIRRNPR